MYHRVNGGYYREIFITCQKPGGTPNPPTPSSQGYPGSTGTPSNALSGISLPQPTNSGSLDLSAIKPANSGNVSLADAIAKARGIAAEKASSRDDPRSASRSHRRSRSPSRSPVRRESFRNNYNPYRDERRDDPRRDTNGRDRSLSPPRNLNFSPPRSYSARDRSPPAQEDYKTEIIIVDKQSVGLIIGRAGENLRRVESETGARVQFMPETTGQTRQCKISGSFRQRSDAKKDIYRVAEENPHARNKTPQQQASEIERSSSNQPALRDGEKSIQIMVPDKTVGLIIGRGGETIRDLQDRSGCHVNIVGENKSINGFRPVNLIGTPAAAAKAKDLINEVVESDTRGAPANQTPQPVQTPYYPKPPAPAITPTYDPYAGYEPPGNDRLTDSVIIPSEAVGMVIGKGGETIKDMQNVTGCKINVSPPSGADINREIGLIGSRMAIESAKRGIWEKVDTVREKQGGHFTRGGDVAYPPPEYQNHYGADPYAAHHPPAYGHPPPPHQGMPPPVPSQADPYAAYGGYDNYVAMWYAAIANQNQGQPPPPPR